MRVLSFDPGGTTGICYQDPTTCFQLTDTRDIWHFLGTVIDLEKAPVDHVVIESYKILPHQIKENVSKGAPIGEEHIESQIIGAIKLWCKMNKIPYSFYEPKMKPTQCKLTQVYPKKMSKAEEHKWDAFNHGRFFLIRKGLAKTALEIEKGM